MIEARAPPRRAAGAVLPRLRRRVPGHRPEPGRAAARARRRRPRPGRRGRPRPVDLRLPRRRRARDPRVPGRSSRPATASRRRCSRCGTTRRFGSRLLRASRGRSRPAIAVRGLDPARGLRRVPQPRRPPAHELGRARSRCSPSTPPGPRPSTSPTCSAGRTSRTASAGPTWRCWCGPDAARSPGCAARSRRPASRSRWPATRRRWSASRRCCRCSCLGVVVDAAVDDPDHDVVGADRARGAADLAARRPRRHRRPRADPGTAARASPEAPARELVRRAVLDPDRCLDGGRRRARPPGAALAELVARARAGSRRRRHGRGGALDAVGRIRLGAAAAHGQPRPAARPPGWPTATSTRCARCSRWPPAPRSSAGTPASATFLATLRAQEIPADTLADRGVRGDAVRLLTAHRVQGPGVAAGRGRPRAGGRLARPAPPRLAAPGRPDRRPTALLPPLTRAAMLAEERRLFYVAATRARQRLVVTAVQSPDDDGEQPSRFVPELGHEPLAPRRAAAPAAVDGRAGRRAAPHRRRPRPAQPLREAAARGCGCSPTPRCTAPGRAGRGPGDLVGAARARRGAERPVRPADEPVTLSASALEGLLTCPAQWFLQREAGGEVVSSTGQGFGKVVHAIAERVAKGELDDDADDLMALRRRGLGPDGVPHALVARARARGGGRPRWRGSSPGTADPVPAPWSPPSRGCAPR